MEGKGREEECIGCFGREKKLGSGRVVGGVDVVDVVLRKQAGLG